MPPPVGACRLAVAYFAAHQPICLAVQLSSLALKLSYRANGILPPHIFLSFFHLSTYVISMHKIGL
jgi:hypothetical protein